MTHTDELAVAPVDPADEPMSPDAAADLTDCIPVPDSEAEGTTSSVYLPPFRVDITVRPDAPHVISRQRIASAVRCALDVTGAPGPASIAIILSGDCELAELNATHMGHEGPTDVLSFPFFPPEAYPVHERAGDGHRDPWVAAALKQSFALPPGQRAHLGDVIISVERAIQQADEGRGGQTGNVRWSWVDELLLLAVHGTLHVCGWDHAEPVEEAAMRALERRVLAEASRPDSRDGQK
jgi:probable rRNA maturation factor